jgi:hypothetical protein
MPTLTSLNCRDNPFVTPELAAAGRSLPTNDERYAHGLLGSHLFMFPRSLHHVVSFSVPLKFSL